MIKKYIKPLIITLTAFVALFVATGAYAGGYDLFMMPDAGKLNNPSTSVHMLYQMFGPLISDILNPSLDVNEKGYLFAYMLKYWNFLIASGAGAFISYHLILAFVKSAENGKFLAGEAEKVGSILRYSLGGFFVAPVIGTGKFCAMQMLFMYGILSGVHAANLLWGTASYGIQMGVTPTIPSNLTSTINTVAGEMYLYDMVDKYTSGTIQGAKKNNPGQNGNGDNCKSGQICIHNTVSQAVDLENQPGFESVGNALIDEHSYHYLHNLSGVLRLYAAKCSNGKLPIKTSGVDGVIKDSNCPAFDAWVLRHSAVKTKPVTLTCDGVHGSIPNPDGSTRTSTDEFHLKGSVCVSTNAEATYHVYTEHADPTQYPDMDPTPWNKGDPEYYNKGHATDPSYVKPEYCGYDIFGKNYKNKIYTKDYMNGNLDHIDTTAHTLTHGCWYGHLHAQPNVKGGEFVSVKCSAGYVLSSWNSNYEVTQPATSGLGVCLPDMTSKQQYTKGEWVINSSVDAINFHGPTSPESSGINIIDASDRISTGVALSPNVAGFEKAVLMDAGTPVDQSESVIVSDGGLIKSQTHGAESHGENKKEAALIAPLGMNLGAIPSDYGFPIVAQSGSPLYYGKGVSAAPGPQPAPAKETCKYPMVSGTDAKTKKTVCALAKPAKQGSTNCNADNTHYTHKGVPADNDAPCWKDTAATQLDVCTWYSNDDYGAIKSYECG